jgi:hypothetical protein
VERWYATGFYALLQPLLTGLTNLVPWAMLDVLIAALLVAGGVAAVRTVRHRRTGRGQAARRLLRLACVIAAGFLIFLACWGLNYRRQPVEARIAFDRSRLTTERVVALAEQATRAVNTLYAPAHARAWPPLIDMPAHFGDAFQRAVRRLDVGWQPVPGRPKPTLLAPYFRWAAVAGLTNPFGLEVLPGPDTLPFERHAVMGHEWAHLAGFAHEAEAGFVGWLACREGDQQAQYSGWLDVWPALVAALPRSERDRVAAMLAEGPRRDLRAAAARNARAVPAIRDAAWQGYDAYLRSQHVTEGVASYQGVVRLLAGSAWVP